MGDSMFMIYRNNQIIYKAPTLQHYFNCPWQVGSGGDNPSKAVVV